MSSKQVAVLGGGFLGCCLALELSQKGYKVDLFEKEPTLVHHAGARNEGKIHLGYVYSNGDFATSLLMIKGARCFFPNLARLLDIKLEEIPTSDPFFYLIHNASMVSAGDVIAHAKKVSAQLENNLNKENYPSSNLESYSIREIPKKDFSSDFDPENIDSVFSTPEYSVSVHWIAEALRKRIACDAAIRQILECTVENVIKEAVSSTVSFKVDGEDNSERYDFVFNCLWGGRLKIDQALSLLPTRPWLWRLKYGIQISDALCNNLPPSFTVVLGEFGDFVKFHDGKLYLSWYPICLGGISHNISPPDWSDVLEGAEGMRIATGTIEALARLAPALSQLNSKISSKVEVKGGLIYAIGKTDINDPSSKLHERDLCGISVYDSYATIDPAKYTLCPYFASQAAALIT